MPRQERRFKKEPIHYRSKHLVNTLESNMDENEPGPTSYNIIEIKKQQPSFSIGKSQKGGAIMTRDSFNFPGVGSYNIDVPTTLKHAPKYSFTKWRKSQKTLLSPGPAEYNVNKSTLKPVTISKSKRLSDAGLSMTGKVGPGSYTINDSQFSQSRMAGVTKFSTMADTRNGAYVDPKDRQKISNPGPGTYSPDISLEKVIAMQKKMLEKRNGNIPFLSTHQNFKQNKVN